MNRPSPSPAFPDVWRALRSAPASGVHNMAVDAALLEQARDRSFGIWRTYAWDRPTVSFGRHEAVRTRFDIHSLSAAGLDAVRRPTGGRALLHAREVTYSVTMPITDRTPWQTAYAQVNDILQSALRSLGVAASLAPNDEAGGPMRPDGPICFEHPAQGEIVVAGAKLVGSAVWRERGAYLQHGSILLRDDQAQLHAAMRSPAATATAPAAVTSLAQCLPETPSWALVADALERALRAAIEDRHAGELSAEAVSLDTDAISRHEIHFRDANWLWRR